MAKAWFNGAADIKVGTIGYGGAFNMGKQHLEQAKLAGMTPFAVCDTDPKRLEVAKADFPGIETYTSLDEMLAKSAVNLVVHITPHNLHFPLAAQCVKAGKHVVTEKPFVITTQEADDLIALANKHDVMVSTYHNRHWDGFVLRAVEQVVEKKVVGEVFRIDAQMGGYSMPGEWWRSSRKISGGILYDWGVHLLEYSLQLVDSEVTEVSGYAHQGYWQSQMKAEHPWKSDANEDEANAVIRFKNGAWINLSVSSLRTFNPPYFLGVFGTKGAYLINWSGWTTRIPGEGGTMVETTGPHPKSEGEKFYANVAGFMTGQEELVITPEWARRPIHILDLAGQSAANGKAMKAKYG